VAYIDEHAAKLLFRHKVLHPHVGVEASRVGRVHPQDIVQPGGPESRPAGGAQGGVEVAAVRRLCRPDDTEPLQPVRSLHYFKPVIAELVGNGPVPDYLAYLQHTLRRLEPHDRDPARPAHGADDVD